MNEKYEIQFKAGNQWAIYKKGDTLDWVFKGSIEEVRAWMELKEKGFDL